MVFDSSQPSPTPACYILFMLVYENMNSQIPLLPTATISCQLLWNHKPKQTLLQVFSGHVFFLITTTKLANTSSKNNFRTVVASYSSISQKYVRKTFIIGKVEKLLHLGTVLLFSMVGSFHFHYLGVYLWLFIKISVYVPYIPMCSYCHLHDIWYNFGHQFRHMATESLVNPSSKTLPLPPIMKFHLEEV